MRPRHVIAALAACGLAGAGLSGCAHSTYSPAVGDCFTASASMLTGEEDITDIHTVRCSRTHNSEVVGVHTLKGEKYPGAETLVTQAQQQCQTDFRNYVGIDYTESVYDLYPLIPTEDTWTASGARTLVCVALRLPSTSESVKDKGEAARHD